MTITEEQKKNLAVAQRINRETRKNPRSPYNNKHIAVLHQQVVAVGESLEDVSRALDAMGDSNREGVCMAASADYDGPHMIWLQPDKVVAVIAFAQIRTQTGAKAAGEGCYLRYGAEHVVDLPNFAACLG